jgi:hypothetical protein
MRLETSENCQRDAVAPQTVDNLEDRPTDPASNVSSDLCHTVDAKEAKKVAVTCDSLSTDIPYSICPTGEKLLVIIGGSLAGLISPLSSSIYLPALNSLAQDMHVSVSLINLTITTYLVTRDNLSGRVAPSY